MKTANLSHHYIDAYCVCGAVILLLVSPVSSEQREARPALPEAVGGGEGDDGCRKILA